MRSTMSLNRADLLIAIAICTAVLGVYGTVALSFASGADLAPLVVAARLFARGRVDALYAHDPGFVDMVDHDLWIATAQAVGYADARYYVYLYPPLWAAALSPFVCGVAPFQSIFWIGSTVNLAAIGISVVIAAARWNRGFLRPLPLLACLAGLCLSYPLFKTVVLGQIQPVVVLCVVIAIAAGQSGRPRLAGTALAIAAAIKLVPGIVAAYWLFNGRRDCVAWFGLAGGALLALSLAVVGWDAHVAFLEALTRMAGGYPGVLENQSLLAWLGETASRSGIPHTIPIQPAPFWMRAAVLLFAASGIAALIRSAPSDKATEAVAVLGLFLLATIAAPMAWLHYFFFLAIPLMILARDVFGKLIAMALATLLSLPTWLFAIKADLERDSLLTWAGAIGSLAVLVLSAIAIRQAARSGSLEAPLRAVVND